jgi:flagellar M-ring protein FliF
MGPNLSGLKTFFAQSGLANSGLAQLGARRLLLMGLVAAALLAALAAVALHGSSGDMGFLYTDLDPTAAQAITEKLKAQNIPFQLSADGTSVMAPQDKLAQLRMGMAADRLGGKVGYEVLDAEEPFGVSSSRAQMNETRAIEGELTRSIETLDSVQRARVHIVMPERAMFAAESRKATAAVTVKTKGRLPAGSVQAIRYLVASSVPELSPESVTIIDQNGTLLARAGEAGDASTSQSDERQAAIEARLRSEIEAMLEPIVGAGKVHAEVAAQIGRDQSREESSVFDPDKQVIGHQVTVESADQNAEGGAGAAGASVGNQLPDAAAQSGSGSSRKSAKNDNSEDTTYENSATHTVTVHAPGKISRLTVAVMVDAGAKGLPPAQVQRLTRLVENTVGFDADRGDSVVIEPMAFAPADTLSDKPGGLLAYVSVDQLLSVAKLLVIALVGLIALRMLKPKILPGDKTDAPIDLTPATPEALALAALAATGDSEAAQQLAAMQEARGDVALLDQEIALAQVDGRIKLSALKRIGDAVSASPAESASVIRQWMNA